MQRFITTACLLATTVFVPVLALQAQQPPPTAPPGQPTAKAAAPEAPAKPSTDPIERIKDEGLKRSQVMATLSFLTDVIGPRLTGSPNMKRANEWTRDKLAAWGLANAHLEAWGPFGRGWSLKRFSAQVVGPQCIPLIGYPKAWSPGTEGTLEARVVYFDAKSAAEFPRFKGKLKGVIVLTSPMRDVAARWEPLAHRKTDSELLALADAAETDDRRFGRRAALAQAPGQADGQRPGPGPGQSSSGRPTTSDAADAVAPSSGPAAPPPHRGRFFSPEMRAQMELQRTKLQFLAGEGPALLVDPSTQGDGGTFFVQSASIPGAPLPMPGQTTRRVSPYDKDAPKIPPQIVLAKEHYNRLVRMCEQGENVKIAVDLAVEFHDGDLMAYNTVAEIPGADLKDEVVMLGGHMDSWHSGTGATDNGAGVAVAMEAVRILKALELKPRRTIRIGLWSGEEEGLLGSRAFVKEHFGRTAPNLFGAPPAAAGAAASTNGNSNGSTGAATSDTSDAAAKREYANFSAYFNLDNGTGKVRGVYMQGNEAVRPIFRKWLQPFRELGASTLSISNTGGTDHLSFDGIGLPGFQFIQDEVEYDTRTHHSNQDVFDRIQADDLKQASVIMAAFVYNTAMTDEKLPRKPAPAPGARSTTPVRAAAAP
jgi:hypothetical protein